uniref:Response regulator receiver protein n=1 Tax=Solibacter usitatus (strain Ellin6076) TaxID=234267 RepID=Q01ZS8_SOLUE
MILLVDDDSSFLQKARALFTDEWQVFFATNAKQALALAEDLEFNVVLVDLVLGTENGYELIGELHRRFPGLPIVAMSGVVKDDLLKVAKAFGATESLAKPITPEWKTIVDHLRHTRESKSGAGGG